MDNYNLSRLLDMTIVQKLADSHHRATGIPIGIIDALDGSILVGSGWQDICLKFHRANPVSCQRCIQSDNYIKDRLAEGEASPYRCRNGLWDIGIPLIIAGRHLATMFLGQFFYEGEVPQREFYIRQAHEFGYDLEGYLAALDRVPVFSYAKVDMILAYDRALVDFIADLAERSLQKIEAERSLQESEEMLRNILTSSPDAIIVSDLNGNIIECNQATVVQHGFSTREELMGKNTQELIAPQDHPTAAAVMRQTLLQGTRRGVEYTLVTRDGREFPAELSASVLRDQAGRPAAFIAITKDITERKQREFELQSIADVSAGLRAAPTRGDMLPVIVNHALSLLQVEGAALVMDVPATNEVMVALARGAWADFTGRRVSRSSSVSGQVMVEGRLFVSGNVLTDPRVLPSELFAGLPAVACVPLIEQVETIGALIVGRKDAITPGELRLLQAIADIAANALFRSSIVETLEQRVYERTQALIEANEHLTELDRLKSKFVSDVSHELRTPVTSLSLYIDLLERGKTEKRPHYVAQLKAQMARLRQMINDILDLSRLERGCGGGNSAPLEINSIVEYVVSMQQPAAEAAGLQLTCTVTENLPLVNGCLEYLTRAVANLVTNAIKYTRSGRVHLTTCAIDGRNCIEIMDTGMGIAPEDIPHLYERFYRGRLVAQSNIPGTGLGLAIVKEIVDDHQGTLEVDSQIGHGSVFRVWLPNQRSDWRLAAKTNINPASRA